MGLVHIYTGSGKGKTTASVGLCTRSAGYGNRVAFYDFMKNDGTGESRGLRKLGVEFFCTGEPEKFTWLMNEEEKAECAARQTALLLQAAENMKNYDLVVLDEILCCIAGGLVKLEDVVRVVKEKAPDTELVLTGRGAPDELIELADYVSVIEARKHPFNSDAKLKARRGVEF